MSGASRVRVSAAHYRPVDGGLEVSALIRNEDERTLLVGCGIRQIQFDRASGELVVCFSDHGRDPTASQGRCRLNTMPRIVEVQPGADVEVKGVVPRKIRRLEGVKGSKIEFEVFDVMGASSVTVHVAVAEAPFYFNPSKGPAVGQLREWGTNVTVVASRTESSASKAPIHRDQPPN